MANQDPIAREIAVWERCVSRARARMPRDPAAGVFGPDSAMWRVGREAALPFYGMRAVLLQVSHPVIAQAGVANSDFRTRFLDRTMRTFSSVYAIMFGDRATALSYAERVHTVHRHVAGVVEAGTSARYAGRPYRANEPDLLFWVLATMIESGFGGFEKLLAPMSTELEAAFYDDMRTLGMLIGIPEDTMPPDVPSFKAWFARAVRQDLEVGPVTRELVRWLFEEGWSVGPFDEAWAIGILEPELVEAFGLPTGRRWRLAHEAVTRQLRLVLRHAPVGVRWVPPYFQAMHRVRRALGQWPGPTMRVYHRLDQVGLVPSLFALPSAA